MGKSEDKGPQNSDDVKKILANQMDLISKRSEEIIGEKKETTSERQELYFLSSALLDIGRYLNENYFDKE